MVGLAGVRFSWLNAMEADESGGCGPWNPRCRRKVKAGEQW